LTNLYYLLKKLRFNRTACQHTPCAHDCQAVARCRTS